jgi:Flp pilus assembly protein TadD
MKLTVDQALQQGVAAHNEGKLQEAERLYRAILEAQPKHPDANHNLGVIAVSVGKPLDALPLFKLALEANPQIGQFWLSYIDALITLERFDEATRALVAGEKSGVSSNKLDALKQRLQESVPNDPNKALKGQTLSEKKKNLTGKKKSKKRTAQGEPSNVAPTQEQINHLLAHYQAGRLEEAEALAISLTQQFPKHPFGWKVLGVVLKQTGRLGESLAPMQEAVTLSPRDAEAHSNLGLTLQELGRLDESEASYRQAITLKPDYAEAHNNLGVTLKELEKLDEAEASYRQAITLKPGSAETHYNLGITLQGLDKLREAEASYRQAITLKPDCAEAYYNLGTILSELARLHEAEASYKKAIELKPKDLKIHSHLLMCLFLQDKKSNFLDELDWLISQEKTSAIIGSLCCRSSLKYGLEKPNLFCSKPLNYVLHDDLRTRYDFEETFVKKAKSILNEKQILNRKQPLLVNGGQTSGNIFSRNNSCTNEIQNIIRVEVEKYREKFNKSEEGLIKKMPTEYSLYGWLINMKTGGNLKPHIHTEGWLSGSIYINVPQKLKVNCGNLVVSLGEEKDTVDNRINEEKTINVVTGSIVLFPASLMHYTIPFESDEERIVLAFDVIPNR